MTRTASTRLGLVCSLAVASFAVVGPAAAQEGVAFKNLLGSIGVIPKEKPAIAYRERAPLVVPPKTALPSPGAARRSAGAGWPNDPDVAARRAEEDEARSPVTWSDRRRNNSDRWVNMTPEELAAGRSSRGSASAPIPGSHRGDSARDVLYMSQQELSARSSSDSDVPAGTEPRRRALTDPPSGLRRTTAATMNRGEFEPRVDQQALDANPMTWLTRKFRGGDDED
ncbi:hypothetical protein EV668_3880 [Enterovirga rhinocerotis]|uniref:DUF3035 domain-containing protein n=2 Tax=Enterovirga rhinocerotis TaxID=1339210 RepID=A0A4R7BTX7_9HYPH|nr:hypothetical protein EV668_3880 [Enterovirga rhinocerotis]